MSLCLDMSEKQTMMSGGTHGPPPAGSLAYISTWIFIRPLYVHAAGVARCVGQREARRSSLSFDATGRTFQQEHQVVQAS